MQPPGHLVRQWGPGVARREPEEELKGHVQEACRSSPGQGGGRPAGDPGAGGEEAGGRPHTPGQRGLSTDSHKTSPFYKTYLIRINRGPGSPGSTGRRSPSATLQLQPWIGGESRHLPGSQQGRLRGHTVSGASGSAEPWELSPVGEQAQGCQARPGPARLSDGLQAGLGAPLPPGFCQPCRGVGWGGQ